MCGLCGFASPAPGGDPGQDEHTIRRMVKALRHRGPDNEGVWIAPENGLAFGHSRLAIVDLSKEGNQPMDSASGRFTIVFNGEVYNFRELRHELEAAGCRFRGQSDTEVMLAGFEVWGIRNSIKRFNGMFAFALWDHRERKLHLVRDRLGIKPLYYGWSNDVFLFGSEISAIRRHPSWQGEVDRNSLALYLGYTAVPAPHSIYKGIYKLPGGCHLTLEMADFGAARSFSPFPDKYGTVSLAPERYWSVRNASNNGLNHPFTGDEDMALSRLEELLSDAVSIRMIADVPLGAFLSGGIDSSLIVALMQKSTNSPVQTFSVGFEDPRFNEAGFANQVASYLKTDHTEFIVSPNTAREVVPLLGQMFDEPFSDSSQIPTYLVSKMTKNNVTVSLSGDGGDELFGGYSRYRNIPSLWNRIIGIPRHLRNAGGSVVQALPVQFLDLFLSRFGRLSIGADGEHINGDRFQKLARLVGHSSPRHMYLDLIRHWHDDDGVLVGNPPSGCLPFSADQELEWSLLRWMRCADMQHYMVDDVLTKVDRSSMAVSLEARVPILDHRIVEFSLTLPEPMLIREGVGKHLLRQLLYRHVPRNLVDRPKKGFGVPIDEWLRGPLRDWAEELLSQKRLDEQGFFSPSIVRQTWQEHLSGNRDWKYRLWDVLMFQGWLDDQKQ
jgi:asparagine synthase (glutamine-hydrolysing)